MIGGINVIPADGDILDTLKIRHSDAPDICMFEPDPKLEADRTYNFEVITRVSVDMWVDALNNKYPEGNWELKIHDTIPWEEHEFASPSDYPQCNIMIIFEPITDGKRLGYAAPNFSYSSHQYVMVVVHTYEASNKIILNEKGDIQWDLEPASLTTIQSILQHELGHAFGLLHYNISTPLKQGELGTDRSMMYPALNPGSGLIHIQEPELVMLAKLYGEDGWGGNMPVLTVKQCDFLDGIKGDCKW